MANSSDFDEGNVFYIPEAKDEKGDIHLRRATPDLHAITGYMRNFKHRQVDVYESGHKSPHSKKLT